MRACLARSWLLGMLVLTASGCFVRAQAGYQTSAPLADPGGAQLEVSLGTSDFRAHGKPLKPIQYGLDLVAHAGRAGDRLGLGLSALWAPLSGWLSDWSPILRLGGRPVQVSWQPTPVPSVSLLGELGIAWFPSRHPTARTIYSLSFSLELFGHQGIRSIFQAHGAVLLGVTFEGPLSRRPSL